MCYHHSLTKIALRSENRFSAMQDDYKVIEEFDDMYHINGWQYPKVPVIASDKPNTWQSLQWGLVPAQTESEENALRIRAMTMNARSDSLYVKPSYRDSAYAGRRCLIPAIGFFEWHKYNKKSYPHYVYMKDNSLFCMGGIWDEWVNEANGDIWRTFSLITTDANPLMAKIHNDGERMPVIIPKHLEMDWLNENLSKDDVLAMTVTYPDDNMQAHTVSKLISSRGTYTNIPQIQEEVRYAELNYNPPAQLSLF